MSQSRRARGTEQQQVNDPDHACNYSRVPHLLLDDAAAGKLGGSAITLYLHYKRVAFEMHGQPMAESLRETKRRTGLSNGTILTARAQLEVSGWIQVQDQMEGEPAIVTLVERWEENCRGHTPQGGQNLTTPGRNPAAGGQKPAAGGRKLTTTNLKKTRIKTLKDIEDPLGDGDVRIAAVEQSLPGMLTEVPLPYKQVDLPSDRDPADELLDALYQHGLHSEPPRSRRELESARDLVAAGATPEDAAAWAHEAIAENRLRIITAGTFLKAWPGWREQRRRRESLAAHSGYEHDPWQNRRPPIAEADLARGAAL